MGAIWLLHLPWWIQEAGLEVDTWPGWETRSRSSGGYDAIHAIGVHHTAGGGTLDGNSQYCWNNASARPIGAMLLAPDGRIRIGAAGATNTQGRGGPTKTSKGTTPKDAGNRYWVSIEAMNRGDGTPWPEAQQEAYVRLCRVLCSKLGLNPSSDVIAHFEWTTRKVDPAGQSRYASGRNKWNMPSFRADIAQSTPPPKPPPSGGYNPPSDWGLFPLDRNKPVVKWQNRNQHVRYLQDALALVYGYKIVRDGFFGQQTADAVKAFQKSNGINVSGQVWEDTWLPLDRGVIGEEPEPPPPPPPSGDVTNVSPCMYYVQEGDSPWRAAERCYGSGAKWEGNFTQGQFSKANYHIPAPGTKGKKTAVKSGEGAYTVIARMGFAKNNANLQTFYDWNGGENRTLQPGDAVYMPT